MRDEDVTEDEPTAEDGETWFHQYKANEVAHGRTPMTWGEWLTAGMPTP